MNLKSCFMVIVAGLMISAGVVIQAETLSVKSKQEIDYLLEFVASSECVFIRNGDRHSGKDAIEHIQKKFDYFEDDIHSAEKFIELSASKSTMSGRKYHIECPGKPQVTSQSWLLKALKSYRENFHADKKPKSL